MGWWCRSEWCPYLVLENLQGVDSCWWREFSEQNPGFGQRTLSVVQPRGRLSAMGTGGGKKAWRRWLGTERDWNLKVTLRNLYLIWWIMRSYRNVRKRMGRGMSWSALQENLNWVELVGWIGAERALLRSYGHSAGGWMGTCFSGCWG